MVALRINVDLAIFQSYLDLEAGDNHSLKIQVARPGIEPRSSCSASQELNHLATAAPAINQNVKHVTFVLKEKMKIHWIIKYRRDEECLHTSLEYPQMFIAFISYEFEMNEVSSLFEMKAYGNKFYLFFQEFAWQKHVYKQVSAEIISTYCLKNSEKLFWIKCGPI